MKKRVENEKTLDRPSKELARPARSRKGPLVEHFEGGNPDPRRELKPPEQGAQYIVVSREWIMRRVVTASIVFPILVLAAVLIGMPAEGAAVVAAALTPLGILARAIARFFF